MNLLIDMGNTRLKWAVADDGRLIKGQTLHNQQLNQQELRTIWKNMAQPRYIGIACVGASALLMLVKSVAVELWPQAEMIDVKSPADGYGVTNAYRQPEKLGVDRWLALVAVRQHYQVPACIVDCGTAITVDLIDVEGKHQGGLISPGLALMKQALAQGADALPLNQANYKPGPADFTEAAIFSGTLMAAAGLIEHVLATQSDAMPLILTGGDAPLIAEQLKIPLVIDADLVLRGLEIVLKGKI